MGLRYSKDYEVHIYEVDDRLKCTMESIIKFIEDIGTEQSERLGAGIQYLEERNMTWVFYEYEINVNRYPRYGEKIKMVTEPYGFNRFYGARSYCIYDEKGMKIVDAKSVFFLIDITKRKLMRVPKEQYKIYEIDEESKIDFKRERLKELEEVTCKEHFRVRYSDIDFNNHVNNTKYVQWAIDSVPLDVLNNYSIANIKVNFEKECTLGEEISVSTFVKQECNEKLITTHKVELVGGKTLTNIIVSWTKK